MTAALAAIGLGFAVLLWPGGGRANQSVAQPAQPALRSKLRALVPLRLKRRQAPVVSVLDALAAAMSAGLSHGDAIEMSIAASPVRDEPQWAAVIADARAGKPLAPAWARLARRTQHPDVAALARAWRVSERLGCPLAEAVRSCAASSRARSELRGKVETATAGTAATSNLLSLLPIGGVAMAWVMGFGPVTLYGNPIALAALVGGFVLIVVGRIIVARLVARVTGGLA